MVTTFHPWTQEADSIYFSSHRVHQYDFFLHYITIVFESLFLGVLQWVGIMEEGKMLKGNDDDDNDNEYEDDNDYDNDEDDGSQSQCLYRSLVRHELTSHPPTLWSSADNLQIICFDLKT